MAEKDDARQNSRVIVRSGGRKIRLMPGVIGRIFCAFAARRDEKNPDRPMYQPDGAEEKEKENKVNAGRTILEIMPGTVNSVYGF